VKRLFDIAVGCVGLVLSIVIAPLIAVLIRRTPGPIIVRQVRVGEGGVPFTMYKFRSMVAGAEDPGHPQWAASCDPRVTRFGATLRRTRLDELPQFWNVLKGDMSIVGPRPERPEFVDLLTRDLPCWSFRHLIKPGITGWAQIQGGYAASPIQATEKLAFDLWYLRHRSLLLDLAIVVKTVPKVLSRQGAD